MLSGLFLFFVANGLGLSGMAIPAVRYSSPLHCEAVTAIGAISVVLPSFWKRF